MRLELRTQQRFRKLVVIVFVVALVGCSAQKAYRRGEREMRRENYDQAVLDYSKAKALNPGNTKISVSLARAKLRASSDHFTKGRRYHDSGQLELAIAEYQQTLMLNPSNQHASNVMRDAVVELQRKKADRSTIEQLKIDARKHDMGPPKLDPRSNIPILLNFHEVEVGKIFESIGKASGINLIYDEKVELDRPRTIDLGNVTLAKEGDRRAHAVDRP